MRVSTHFALWMLGLARAETQTSAAERDALASAAASRKRLVEVGVWHGVTTRRLKQAMASDGILYAVDPFEAGRLRFSMQRLIAHREVARSPGAHVSWIRLPSAAAAERVLAEGPVDFVFIDGEHSFEGLASDWSSWSGGVEPGGIIGLHDSVSSKERNIDEAGSVLYTRKHVSRDRRFDHVGTVDTLTLWRRRA